VSAVSVGNVGQFTADLLINNLDNCKKVGRIFHDALEPVVGNDITLNGQVSLMTSCEIYHDPDNKIVILQFHAPVLQKQTNEFVNFLVDWIQEKKFNEVICLSSTFASERNDAQLVGPPFRYLSSSSSTSIDRLSQLEWKHLESRQFPAPPVISGSEKSNNNGQIHIPGAGITRELLDTCESRGIPLVALIMFVSEGDNIPDAQLYFRKANQVFQWISKERENTLNIPVSWTSFFGPTFPQEIY